MDHGDAYATLACPSAFVGQRAGISGTIQILSGSDRRAFSYGCQICRTSRSAGRASWTGGILAVVESVAVFAGGWKAI